MDFECVKDERESEIWQLFLLNKTDKLAKCSICPLTLKITGGRTSNMWQHVKNHHFTAYQSLRQPTRVKKVAKTKEQMVSKLVSKIKKKNLNYGRRHGIRSTSTVKSEIIPGTEAEKRDNNSELINDKLFCLFVVYLHSFPNYISY